MRANKAAFTLEMALLKERILNSRSSDVVGIVLCRQRLTIIQRTAVRILNHLSPGPNPFHINKLRAFLTLSQPQQTSTWRVSIDRNRSQGQPFVYQKIQIPAQLL